MFRFLHTFASCPLCYIQKQFHWYRYWLVNVARGNSIQYQKDIEGMCRQKSAHSIYVYIVGDLRKPRKLDTVYHSRDQAIEHGTLHVEQFRTNETVNKATV